MMRRPPRSTHSFPTRRSSDRTGAIGQYQADAGEGVVGVLRRAAAHAAGIVGDDATDLAGVDRRSEEHTSELQSLMRISYAVFCLKKKTITTISVRSYRNIRRTFHMPHSNTPIKTKTAP